MRIWWPLLGALCACHDDEPKPTPAGSPSSTLIALGLDASGVGVLVDPPRPAGDFKADVTAFTTMEDCMRDRSKVDPVLGDALENIGYDTFVRDACRVLEASKTKDPRKCSLIDASTLKARCNAVVAIVMQKPDACPRVSAGTTRGRDPLCIAQASRSPILCAAVEHHDRPTCEASLGKDEKPCESLLIDEDRASCVRDAIRWRSSLADGAPLVTSIAPVKATLEVHGAEGRPDPKQTTFDWTQELSRGVVIVKETPRWRAMFGDVDDLGLTPKATSPMSQAKLGFQLKFGPEPTAKVDLEGTSLSVPGASSMTCASSKCELVTKVRKVDATRGGAVSLEIDGTFGGGAQAFKVHADITTFVRDVMDPAAPE